MQADLKQHVGILLRSAGLPAQFESEEIRGGGNNRVFRIVTPDCRLLLKAYFHDPRDARDRLHAEYSFCTFAWDSGLRCIPRPIACDREHHLGLYEFIDGARVAPGEAGAREVEEAVQFYQEVNRHRGKANHLPDASEACFSLGAHLALVGRRVQRLADAPETTEIERKARAFTAGPLSAKWRALDQSVREAARKQGLSMDDEIGKEERRISPSDFGFHNAIRTADGALRFIDFEYAGWDEPAKMVCDFFAQVAVPVAHQYLGGFFEGIAADCGDLNTLREKVRLLLPVYQLKWICIVLNDFLPADSARRRFSIGPAAMANRKTGQLAKARDLLDNLLDPERVPL